ncbi:DUF2510 domain-containing protein [Microbacterium jejuense]|uniref:DUF2510 domain-containing protein n=1 Tax=Microbacterium jejuense TaxID=1263637 RepID=A0ABS7HHH1_9MICO|nr:DUF2510 domain-containing protein [Microbacterium jejuense]MBW9092362.1 DUF2510 domain-containing protein [Microbacterium jejuense]
MTTTPPGWYDDGHGAMRWWDGVQWTEHVAQPDPVPSPAPSEAEIVAAQLGFEQPAAAPADTAAAASLAQQQPVAQPPYGAAQAGTPQYAPAHYPAADPAYAQPPYPGAAPGGAFAAATEPRSSSKLWIVWVVLGVVLLGIVIAVAVVVPLLILNATSGGTAAQTEDEKVAVGAVQTYDHAWQTGDCDELLAVTTEEFRAASQYVDCETFESDAANFDDTFDDYELAITDVVSDGDEIEVTTRETYTLLVDENGDPADPSSGATVYHYTLVPDGAVWVIDDLYYDE